MGEPDNLQSVKTRIKYDTQALVDQQSFLNTFDYAIKLFELQLASQAPKCGCEIV